MADYETLFPGRFLKSADLEKKDATVTIKSISSEEIDGKEKVVIGFEGTKKQFVCNRTNAEAIKLMFGRDYLKWIGRKITLYRAVMQDPFSGGTVQIGATRVRGSPEIDKPMSAEVKRGRKTLYISVVPTGAKAAAQNGNGAKPQHAATPTNGEPSEAEKQAILAREQEQSDADRPF